MKYGISKKYVDDEVALAVASASYGIKGTVDNHTALLAVDTTGWVGKVVYVVSDDEGVNPNGLYMWESGSWSFLHSLSLQKASEVPNDSGVVGADVKLALNTIDTQISAVTKTLYVDKNRIDVYTENGSITKPYKTIGAAVTAIGAGNGEIIIAAGIYAELVDCSGADCINIKGVGNSGSGTVISGGFIGSIGTYSVVDVRIFGGVTNNSSAYFTRCDLRSGVILNHGTQLLNCDAETVVVNGANTVVVWIGGSIGTSDNKAVVQNDGQLVLSHLSVSNISATKETIDSDGGTLQIVNTVVANYGGGKSADINNVGNNSIMDVDVAGSADCHASSTRIEGLRFLAGSLNGSNLILRPASRLDNDSSVVGVTVKDALETLDTNDGAFLKLDGTRKMTSDLDMDNHSILNIKVDSLKWQGGGEINKADYDDAVTKKHDSKILGTQEIDETDIADKKIIQYNNVSGKLEYEDAPSGGGGQGGITFNCPAITIGDSENIQIYRFTTNLNAVIKIWAAGLSALGGGQLANSYIQIYNETDGIIEYQTNSRFVSGNPIQTLNLSQKDISIRATNGTGTAVDLHAFITITQE